MAFAANSSLGIGLSPAEAAQLFDQLDTSKNGMISKEQVNALLQRMQGNSERHTVSMRRIGEYSVPGQPRVISQKRLKDPPANWQELHAGADNAADLRTADAASWRQREFEEFRERMAQGTLGSGVNSAQGARTSASNVLPDAYRLPQYGPRQAWWVPQMQIPEENNGVIITQEFGTPSQAHGMHVPFNDDEAITNPQWRYIGPFSDRRAVSKEEEPLRKFLHDTADYRNAQDLLANRRFAEKRGPDYFAMKQQRDATVYEKVDQAGRRSVMDSQQVQNFFADSEAVMYDAM